MSVQSYVVTDLEVTQDGGLILVTAEDAVAIPGGSLIVSTNGVANTLANVEGWFDSAKAAAKAWAVKEGKVDVRPIRVDVTAGEAGTLVAFNQ